MQKSLGLHGGFGKAPSCLSPWVTHSHAPNLPGPEPQAASAFCVCFFLFLFFPFLFFFCYLFFFQEES